MIDDDYNPYEDEPDERTDPPPFCSFQDIDEVDEDGDPHIVDCERVARFGILRPAQPWSDAQYACKEHLGEICEFDGMDAECRVIDLEALEEREASRKDAPVTSGLVSVVDEWDGQEPF